MSRSRRANPDWSAVAERLASAVPVLRFDADVRRWIERAGRSKKNWYVALSGGADSVALLLLLWAHWPRRRGRLRVLHFDHRLRGAAAARADREFCRRLCAALHVKLTVGQSERRNTQRQTSDLPAAISEAHARAERMAFLHNHADVLWLGHHQDDVAETILMRLSRGSGAAGLSAPRPVQRLGGKCVHLRPLLGLKKSEIVRQLSAAGGIWQDDSSNTTDRYFRNRVRRRVIPAWIRAAERDAIAGAARSRQLLEEDDTALERWLDEIDYLAGHRELRLDAMAGKPRAIVRRAVHRWLIAQNATINVSRQAIEALIDAVERGAPTRHSLGPEQFAVIRNGRLKFENRKSPGKFQRGVN